jgi:hypothetical protein
MVSRSFAPVWASFELDRKTQPERTVCDQSELVLRSWIVRADMNGSGDRTVGWVCLCYVRADGMPISGDRPSARES